MAFIFTIVYICKYVIFLILIVYFYLDLQLLFNIKNVLNNLKIKRQNSKMFFKLFNVKK